MWWWYQGCWCWWCRWCPCWHRHCGSAAPVAVVTAIVVVVVVPPLLQCYCCRCCSRRHRRAPVAAVATVVGWWSLYHRCPHLCGGGHAPTAPSCPLLLSSPAVEGVVRLKEKEKVAGAHLRCCHPPRHGRCGRGQGCGRHHQCGSGGGASWWWWWWVALHG